MLSSVQPKEEVPLRSNQVPLQRRSMWPGLQVTFDSPEARQSLRLKDGAEGALGSTEPTWLAPCTLVCGEPEETL